MPHAIVLGHGQIGRAVAARLARHGWTVRVLSRSGGADAPGVQHRTYERSRSGTLLAAIGDGADLFVDTIAFDEQDAAQLLTAQDRLGAIVAISTASVYRDAEGRSLDTAAVTGFPCFPGPITEATAMVVPGPASYSTRKAAMEQALFAGARVPAVTLRAGAIHGTGSRHPREWWFVKRLLDGRDAIPLALCGESRFHTAAAANIATLAEACWAARATGPFNAVDPDAPSALAIGETVAAVMARPVTFVPLEGQPGTVGAHPWAVPQPFVLSDAAARAIGYLPAGDHAALAAPYIRWLAEADPAAWRARFPQLAAYPYDLFDYRAEDVILIGR